MPRRNRPKRDKVGPPPGASLGWGSHESAVDGDWIVRSVPGASTTKMYRCPGCDHEIRPGTPHVVTWPADDTGGVADRRHWHRSCWNARHRRGPSRRF
ncbi:hypothetical protein [Haloechinothrix halophila]|uniref:hypothetical protein n=1 Tax=Haloechinothrix halophila TaxID=1069073 RepID=UPI0005579ADE|nr:hypothetical protein [Haloechinothrix halophila]